MGDCNCKNLVPAFRVVQTISERNGIPCDERLDGMVVVVVNDNYQAYKLKPSKNTDVCGNTGWVRDNLNYNDIRDKFGHYTETVYEGNYDDITALYLNTKYPDVMEGFRVFIEPLNTTFEKIKGTSWKIYSSIKLDK